MVLARMDSHNIVESFDNSRFYGFRKQTMFFIQFIVHPYVVNLWVFDNNFRYVSVCACLQKFSY